MGSLVFLLIEQRALRRVAMIEHCWNQGCNYSYQTALNKYWNILASGSTVTSGERRWNNQQIQQNSTRKYIDVFFPEQLTITSNDNNNTNDKKKKRICFNIGGADEQMWFLGVLQFLTGVWQTGKFPEFPNMLRGSNWGSFQHRKNNYNKKQSKNKQVFALRRSSLRLRTE